MQPIETLTFSFIAQVIVVLMAVWGFIKVVKEIVQSITARHDREQKWDEMSNKWTENLQQERDKIYDKYDNKLEEIEKKIDTNHSDTELKIQQLRTELFVITECTSAILDGLKQLNCNGHVTEAKHNLDEYLRNVAHEREWKQ